MADEPKTKVRKVGGLKLVDIPGVKGRVAVGDVVEVPKDRAAALVAGGEFEAVKDPPKTDTKAAPAKEGD